MSRISSAMIPQSALVDLGRAQRELIEAARQSSAQTRADDLKGYGREAQTLISAQRMVARSEGFIANMRELKTRMELQDVALSRASEAISQLKEDLFQNFSLERGDGVRSHLEEAFAVLKDTMNTQLSGRYLFGGVLNDRAPIKANTLADLASNPLTTSIEQGAASQTVRIEDQRTVQAGVVADDVATLAFAAIKRLVELDQGPNGPFTGPLTTVQKDALQDEISALGQAFNRLLEGQSENGRLLNDVDASNRRQNDQLEALNGAIGEIVDVDLAAVAVRLNQAQFSYEASASVFNTLRGLTLLNVLR